MRREEVPERLQPPRPSRLRPGAFRLLAKPRPQPPKALPLPADEAAREEKLTLNLYRPDPPRGFLREPVVLEVGLGENPYEKALLAWAQATGSPTPLGLFAAEGRLVVDLPKDFVRGLDAEGEVYRLYSLAYTLLATFPEGSEVRFLVEGQPSPGLAHLDLEVPVRLP
ncbi:GerMN domain-containing protein [Thermus thermophilus]